MTPPMAPMRTAAAVLIGAIGGVIACLAAVLLEKLKIDDAVGAAPVHLFNGAWGVLAVGIFANGNPDTALWNGVESPVTGLLYGGGGQFLAQVIDVVAIFLVVFAASYAFFKILAAFKVLRSSPADELAGLDLPEMGAEGYPKDWEPAPEAPVPGTVRRSKQPVPALGD